MNVGWRAVLVAVCATTCATACAHRGTGGEARRGASGDGAAIVLFRDAALVQQRVEVDVPEAGSASARVLLGAGVTLTDVKAIDLGELTVVAIRQPDAPSAAEPAVPVDGGVDGGVRCQTSYDLDCDFPQDKPPPPPDPADAIQRLPVELAIDVTAPHGGHYALTLAYKTRTLTWEAAYTLTTTPERAEVDARGAVVISNAAGIAFPRARVQLVDTTVDRGQQDQVADLIARVDGRAAAAAAPSSDERPALPRDLGLLDVVDGAVRAELYPPGARRALRSVLVYDPIGTALDNPFGEPNREDTYGVTPPASPRVIESAEIVRDTARDLGLPGGAARLLERQPDGTLRVLAAGRMFDEATRAASFDTVPVGVARDVVGKRTRRELAIDDELGRVTEEFAIELDNQRAQPVPVVVREHLYRSSHASIAYASVPHADDGPQAVSLRTVVPPHGRSSILYVVVYWWDARA